MALHLLLLGGLAIVMLVGAAWCVIVVMNVAVTLVLLAVRLVRAMATTPLGVTNPEAVRSQEFRLRSSTGAVTTAAGARRPHVNSTTTSTPTGTAAQPLSVGGTHSRDYRHAQ